MRYLLIFLLLAATRTALAQNQLAASPDSVTRLRPWYRPSHMVLQAAGGMGLLAGGVGYTFRRDRLETELLVGYVPEKHAGSSLAIATAKLLYSPYTVRLSEKLTARPLTFGLYVSYAHGTINDEARGQYTRGYYWFSTDTRVGPLLGGRLTYLRPTATQPERQRRVSAYYELGTNELYLVSYVTNFGALSATDILTLGLGLKLDF